MTNKKKKTSLHKPKISSIFLADTFTKGENNKLNTQGIFSVFWAWGYPALRRWSVITVINYLPHGKHTIIYSLRKKFSKNETTLGFVDIEVAIDTITSTVPLTLAHHFESEGTYEIICQIKGSLIKLVVPFEVKTMEWPEYSDKEIEFAKSAKSPILNIRANIHCKDCLHAYIFEESILIETVPVHGVYRFPSSGEFQCEGCEHILRLKDIQGQLRASLKEIIINAMGGGN